VNSFNRCVTVSLLKCQPDLTSSFKADRYSKSFFGLGSIEKDDGFFCQLPSTSRKEDLELICSQPWWFQRVGWRCHLCGRADLDKQKEGEPGFSTVGN